MNKFPLRLPVCLLAGLVFTWLITNKKGDSWEEYVRNGLYRITADSIPDYDVDKLDSLGVPYTIYATQNGITPGKQYNATIVCNYALAYYDSFQKNRDSAAAARFTNCQRWLRQNMERHHDYALFRFTWQQPWYDSVKAPFTSGMTSALAMQVFSRGFALSQDSTLLQDAQLLLQGFAVAIDSGGFTFKEDTGWWYEEIADAQKHTPRILDGHLFAVLGLYDFYTQTHDSLALAYFKKGEAELLHALPVYNAGKGQICYDKYCKPADKKYRRIITGQLEQLWKIDQHPRVQHYWRLWAAPLEKPYAIRMLQEHNRSGFILFFLLWAFTAGVVDMALRLAIWLRQKQ